MKKREAQAVTLRRQGQSARWRGQGPRGCAFRRVGAGVCALTLVIALGVGSSPALAGAATSSLSPSLRAQARELYAPVRMYEHSTTAAQRARARSLSRRVGRMVNACQAPYLKRLLSRRAAKLDMLWNDAALLDTYQADVKPTAAQLARLAASWAALSLRYPAMKKFVHAVAAEFRATLHAAPFDSCGFVREIAAHHFSYAWAKQSSYGVEAARWWTQISQAGDRTNSFWQFVYPNFGGPEPPSAGAHLFTKHELAVLPNLPGELG